MFPSVLDRWRTRARGGRGLPTATPDASGGAAATASVDRAGDVAVDAPREGPRDGVRSAPDAARTGPVERSEPQLVLAVGALMLLAVTLGRGWALWGSWFYYDDYPLLIDADRPAPDVDYLLTPYSGNLMPLARLIVWCVHASGELNWTLAGGFILALETAAGAAALWMLVTLFGARWAVLAPFGLYLTSAITVPAMMWWAAAISQVGLQVAFFLVVGCWVRYLRTHRLRWLALTALALAFGLSSYTKTLLVVPVLIFLALAYFAQGSLLARCRHVLRTLWPAAVGLGALLTAYLAYYSRSTEEPFTEVSASALASIADSMLGTAFASGVVGGPWRWLDELEPVRPAGPPLLAQHLAWVLIVLVALYAVLRRRRAARAWLLLGGYLVGLFVLLATSRAPIYGADIGLQYRYLTDAPCAVALCVGLAFLPVRGAVESSEPRERPLLLRPVPTPVAIGLVVAVCVSGLVSSTLHVRSWHTDNASDGYVHRLRDQLEAAGAIDLVDSGLSERVQSPLFAPENSVSAMVRLLDTKARFPRATDDLAMVDDEGNLQEVRISPGVASLAGPVEGCGWRIPASGLSVPLTGRAFPYVWWMRIGYLSSRDSSVVVSAGRSVVRTEVLSGLHDLWVRVDGSFASVGISGLEEGVTLCVDTIEVGQPQPGGPLS